MTTSIAEAAQAALEARQAAEAQFRAELRETMIRLARSRLAEFFAGSGVDVDSLEVVYADADQFVTVLADTAPAPVHLAVSDESDVRLVELIDGGWTRMSEVIPTLADLGALLEQRGEVAG